LSRVKKSSAEDVFLSSSMMLGVEDILYSLR